ncbi:NAD(P)/FAD-dependent oxidoreductase, partial [Vibrio parahaemolyticus]|uniref:NAD(P)/FAD-dependent oxidoreductase n=1 Tax=Vibrio parahaemolyticus TaxID=670 RepID=UPI0017B4C945|nr:electron transfer flavoprotein-ubiquinone oxidoreductase [Vibrio parahaemolyticus]
YLGNDINGHELPSWAVPNTLHNKGNYIISLGSLCRWMALQAENLGVEVYPGFTASQAIIDEDSRVCGVITGDMGLDKNGEQKGNFEPGIELRAKFTLFAEGARGHIGKQLINRFNLAEEKTPQHYAIDFKRVYESPPD